MHLDDGATQRGGPDPWWVDARRRADVDLRTVHLVVVLRSGTRLVDEVGRSDLHQAALYRRLVPHLGSITWISPGDRRDEQVEALLGGVRVLTNRWGLAESAYWDLLPRLHRRALARTTLVKAEQIVTGEVAADLAEHLGVPFLSRSGFSLGDFARHEGRPDADERARREQAIHRRAAVVAVSSDDERDRARAATSLPPDHVQTSPNFVDLEVFHPERDPTPDATPDAAPTVVTVGRLVPQKGLEELVEAVAPLEGVRLRIIGRGGLEHDLRARIARLGAHHVELVGERPQSALAEELRSATLFVQPSRYEGGHPKTLLEAMACGLPVVVRDAPGIRGAVRDGVDGVLWGGGEDELRGVIERLLGDAPERERLGAAAREHVVDELSLDRAVARELALLALAAAVGPRPPRPQRASVLRALGRTARWRLRRTARAVGRRIAGGRGASAVS